MSYCEDCGLLSCYIRGGYCEVAKARARSRAEELRPRRNRMTIDNVLHVYASDLPPMLNSDQWIEVIW